MKYALAALCCLFLMLLGAPSAFCSDTPNGWLHKETPAINEDKDDEGELPDDPLAPDSTSGALLPDKGEKTATGHAGKEPLSEKAKKRLEAIRESLRGSGVHSPDDFDIPLVLNEAVDRHIKCFTGTKRDVFARWLVRSEKYAPTIRGILKKNGLPEDLVYLAMIESGFNMKARSRAKAIGPWQFMDGTGKQYGLKVDRWVDERYDLEKSTVAAARYLKSLFDQFGCWYLAAASYNAGENRVKKAMERQETADFWKLREYKTLPKETQEYVPQLIAAALIAKDPREYGFDEIDTVPVHKLTKIAVPGGIPLKGIARALSIEVADLRALNPEILKGITPPSRKEYMIKLPGTPELDVVSRRLEAALADDRQVVDVVRHCVSKKDSMARILKKYGISRSELALVNDEEVRVKRGNVIYIPRFASLKKEVNEASGRSNARVAVRIGGKKDAGMSAKVLARSDDDDVVVLKHQKKGRKARVEKANLASERVRKAPPASKTVKTAKKTRVRPHRKTAR